MNPEIKKMWTAALRSGEYLQGQGRLKNNNDNTFCCLGVLCDIAVKNNIISAREQGFCTVYGDLSSATQTSYSNPSSSAFSISTLPYKVIEWAGLDSSNPEVRDLSDERSTLVDVNDDGEATFAEIADMIERSL